MFVLLLMALIAINDPRPLSLGMILILHTLMTILTPEPSTVSRGV
jgi:hypothetical protein